MRKKDDTLRQSLLDNARALAEESGPEAVNIRTLAGRAGVAVGTVYNYFSSKEEILLALTEAHWKKALEDLDAAVTAPRFLEQLGEIYAFLRGSIHRSGGMLMRSLGGAEMMGQERMALMQEVLGDTILHRLEGDDTLRPDCWNETFTREGYTRFLLLGLLQLLRSGAPDAGFLLELVRRTLY